MRRDGRSSSWACACQLPPPTHKGDRDCAVGLVGSNQEGQIQMMMMMGMARTTAPINGDETILFAKVGEIMDSLTFQRMRKKEREGGGRIITKKNFSLSTLCIKLWSFARG